MIGSIATMTLILSAATGGQLVNGQDNGCPVPTGEPFVNLCIPVQKNPSFFFNPVHLKALF
jgi:hypothetical protein